MHGIVVVGRGPAVQAHASRYERFDGVTVCGVVGETDAASSIEVPTHSSVVSALSETDAEGVDVCGPGFDFAEAVDDALDAGVPVRCDPPFALHERRFDAVVSEATDGDGWVLATSPHRFSRLYEQLRSAVEKGSIGDVGVARVKRTAPFDGSGWNVTYDGVAGVDGYEGVLCAIAAHDVDILEWTFGPIERAFARARAGDRYDTLHAMLAFRDGGRATVEVTWCGASAPSPHVEVEYSGSHGRLDFEDGTRSAALWEGAEPLSVDPPEDDCCGRSLRAFADALRDDEGASDGVGPTASTRGAIALRRSIEKGRPVPLAEVSE
ncbi:Gfo/Idh/MocA family protein [Halopelagius fulvigenes]|uniref:Gfo/Idh/MocA family protein n=1 Tax=Halopelagius fulvigenes TaxID=1198324 RepID=A0ABD5TSQ6_9EURY